VPQTISAVGKFDILLVNFNLGSALVPNTHGAVNNDGLQQCFLDPC